MGIIKLSDLSFFTTLGIFPSEQENPIEIKVSVEIKSRKIAEASYEKGKILQGIDYVLIYRKIKETIEKKHHFLVEELAREINDNLAEIIRDFEYVKTKIIKPNPFVFSKGGFFEAELTLVKS